ncbi:MAG: hypothetical protein IPH93_16580 [Saprospiraceae bacterium]|nr:hypothetical protein [Saprospiraceae bacterium]
MSLDAYQKEKYPELIHSLPHHGKSKKLQLSDPEQKIQDREGKLSKKQELFQIVETVFNRSKSVDNFLAELKSEGYNSYNRGGKIYGLEDESGKHYRFKTLGFDLNKLEELTLQAQTDAKQLQELANLRESKSQEREQEDGIERDYEKGIENNSREVEYHASEEQNEELDIDNSEDIDSED